jgi:histidyl-tRNA synthetase
MATLKAVRGTRDLLPPETELWNRIEATARQVFARYNFGEIRTPIFEDTGLFARSVGEETDIVSKELYSWEDGERFDERKMVDAWLKLHAHEIREASREMPFDSGYIDLVVRRSDGKVELIEFKSREDTRSIQQLQQLVDSYAASSAQGSELGGRLVLPARRGTQPKKLPKPSPGIEREELSGDFYLSSQSLTLRPENTAGVVRAYLENGLGESGQLQKLYYIGPQFRRERPQKGRYRQFWQIGAEVIGPPSSGSESPLRDAEVLEMLATLLQELGITGWTLELNSVGSAADRARYNDVLRAALVDVAPKMCGDCQRRAVTNPLRVLDCKVPEDQPIIENLPKIGDSLGQDSKDHFAAVLAALDAAGVPYKLNQRLVRGLDYYTRTTFEFTHGGLGAQNALLGGGRYDGLSEAIGGPKAPGIGFAIGLDRLVLTLQGQEQTQAAAPAAKADAYIAPIGESLNAAALILARELRRAGLRIELGDGSFRLKKSFEAADKIARRIVILGEDEHQSGILTVKDFTTGTQTKVPRAELAAHLARPAGE